MKVALRLGSLAGRAGLLVPISVDPALIPDLLKTKLPEIGLCHDGELLGARRTPRT